MLKRLLLDPRRREDAELIAKLRDTFPSVDIAADTETIGRPIVVRAADWVRDEFDFWAFDEDCEAAGDAGLTLVAVEDEERRRLAAELLTRCQRLAPRRNAASRSDLFDAVAGAHKALHDCSKPLVLADFRHALDVWQWVLRLEPEASLELQFAALFHDIERLVSEPDARVEQHAPDYQTFKDLHARNGAEMAFSVLYGAGAPPNVTERVCEMIARHERTSDDPELALLNDADALSFFSLNSPGYAKYFGPEQTRKKVEYTWNRLRPESRHHLESVRLVTLVLEALEEQQGAVTAG